MKATSVLKSLLQRMGLDVNLYTPATNYLLRRKLLLKRFGTSVVFDVGANVGNYALQLRRLGYRGRIVSFEPLSSAYKHLFHHADNDPLWNTVRVGLGERDGTARINIAGNSESSSLLEMLPSHLRTAPDSVYVGDETIEIRRLDSVFAKYAKSQDIVFLKIDAQGYETKILDGATSSLAVIDTIQLEMSLVGLYRDEVLLPEMAARLYQLGYILVSIEPGYTDRVTGQVFQIDGIFHRERITPVR